MEAKKEWLFCLLLRNASSEEIRAVCDGELEKYIRESKGYSPGSMRVSCACRKFIDKDEPASEAEYREAVEMRKMLSNGDAKMEKKLLESIFSND